MRISSAEQIDLDEVVARLATSRQPVPWSTATLDWRLRPPEGMGHVALADDGSVAAVAPAVVSQGGTRTPVWQLVAWDGARAASAVEALREELGTDPMLIAGTVEPPGDGWRIAARLPAWVTGPDPFVSTQRDVDQLDAGHDSLGEVVAGRPEQALVRDAARWTWRYLRHPEREYTVQDVPGSDGCDGIIVMAEKRVRGARSVVILELHARDGGAHYALLKAARRWSWDLGGLPVMLRGEPMSRRYAFTAGYLPATPPVVRRTWTVRVHGEALPGRWKSWLGDADGA